MPLIVTASNKMRTAKEKIINVALSEKAMETPILYNEPSKNNVNLAASMKLINEVQILKFGKQYGAKNIDKSRILELLENIEVPVSNVRFDPIAIHAFISQYAGDELAKWDVVLISAKGKPYKINKSITVNQINRSFDIPKIGRAHV